MNTGNPPPLWLLTLLIMFPQLVESIYSPALPDIARSFMVSPSRAAQTLAVYFVAFAVGVALWGYLSDSLGRRPAMMAGLVCYGAGSLMAMVAMNFTVLLIARMISALGAAAGSIVVQTMLRDSYKSTALVKVFSLMGTALAFSPVLGLISGGGLVSFWNHQGVFSALGVLAMLLLILTSMLLPETRPARQPAPRMIVLASTMLADHTLWKNALLIALFNTMLFSYYSLAPFLFERLGWQSSAFGWTGLVLAAAALVGNLLNRKLIGIGKNPGLQVRYASSLALLSSLVAWGLQNTVWVLVPVAGVVIAYAIAIPNILSMALHHYRAQAGTAGALFGLTYYLLLGVMLSIAGLTQQLGWVFTVCSLVAISCSWLQRDSDPMKV